MKLISLLTAMLIFISFSSNSFIKISLERGEISDEYKIQWEKSYGKLWWWSARYEGAQPVGDADNDGKNELLIGGRDPFLRVMKWDENKKIYYEQARIVDPVFGIGYSFMGLPQPFGSATGFGIADIDNDGKNEVGVAWGRHFSAFKWDGSGYKKIGMYIVEESKKWGTTLDCIIGDADNDGKNEVVVTGGYSSDTPEIIVLSWDGEKFVKESEWNFLGRYSVYFPWIADVDEDGKNEIICNTDSTCILKWNGEEWEENVIASHNESYPFGCVAKDSDNDGKPEIHVTFYLPMLKIYEYENGNYTEKASFYWEGEEGTIEAIDVGDVDDDGIAEIAVGTDKVHILQWNGKEYFEEHVIEETHGLLAVTCIGDMDNDGKNEVHAGAVGVNRGEEYEAWIFKHI
ncbi:MAG TPA: VCBS repeat-containing protein [Thermoplasmatales archaeon]|nr:VCBS repeat-containing protein [Thermoplasmatales archaeon]